LFLPSSGGIYGRDSPSGELTSSPLSPHLQMRLLIALCAVPALISAFPQPFGDPFSPLGSWHKRGPPCGLPPFLSKLPEEAQNKIKAVWLHWKEDTECREEQKLTFEIIHALPEELREKIFAGRCGPSFLRNVSPTVRKEFKAVWFDHKMSIEAKELALKKLAFSLLSGESLALFNKWDEELQQRKIELSEKIENLSESAKNALEEWRAIRQEERDFLARLPKEIREELRTLCHHWPRLAATSTTTTTTSTTEVPSTTTTTEAATTTNATSSSSTSTEKTVEETTMAEEAEKEFAHLLDFVMPDELSADTQCAFYN
ncbi:hypothetical protein PENTCL1PPCAC_28364, partial [Pristionchus entomophagus]